MENKRRFLLINGPNLNLLGSREPGVYGSLTLCQIEERLRAEALSLGVTLDAYQSNHEQVLAERIQDTKDYEGLIINAGAYTHTGRQLAQAVLESGLPAVEVHISNVFARETFRHQSLLTPVCTGVICGLGYVGYRLALLALAQRKQ